MQVETYELTEITHNIDEGEREEAAKLVESLNLGGQSLYVQESPEDEICAYRKMTKEEYFVYDTLLASKFKIADYRDGPIPLRVLQVAEHAKQFFDELYVWCPLNADIKDPLLVGRNGEEYGDQEHFILARWGEVLAEYGDLFIAAGEKTKAKLGASLKRALADVAADIEAISTMTAKEIVSLGKTSASYFSVTG